MLQLIHTNIWLGIKQLNKNVIWLLNFPPMKLLLFKLNDRCQDKRRSDKRRIGKTQESLQYLVN